MDIAVIVLAVLSTSFFCAFVFSVIRINKMSKAFARLYVAQAALEEFLTNQKNDIGLERSDDEIHKENFIKFLSDSRDWAYKYIEDVQGGLQRFIKEVSPQLEYYNKYGAVVDGIIPSHDFALKKISKEVEELKKFLPQVANDRR
jgi:Tfp pilus assembly protein PilE